MAMREQAININFKAMNEQSPDSLGPMGMMSRIENGIAKRFYGEDLRVQKRPGSTSLTATTYAAGSVTTSPEDPKLLSSWRDQLVLIGGTTPYVYSDELSRWERPSYPFATTPSIAPQTLTRRPLYNGNAKTYAPDTAAVGNVLCQVLSDSTLGALITFVDADGVQIRAPFAATGTAIAKATSDGAQFWVFSQTSSHDNTYVQVFDTNGAQLATTTLAWGASRTRWDVGYQAIDGLVWAVTDVVGTTSFVTMTYAVSTITVVTNVAPAINSTGGIARLEDLQGDTSMYIVAVNGSNDVAGYQLSSVGAITHTYTIAAGVAGYIGNATGFVVNGSFDIRVAFSVLVDNTSYVITPATTAINNKTHIYNVTFAGVSSFRKTMLSLAVVSRAFVDADGTWRFVAYYQSMGCAVTATAPGGATIRDVSYLGAQPSFFVVEFSATVPTVVGQFDLGAAYAFYATSRNSVVFNPWHISSVATDSDNVQHVALGYLGTQQVFGDTLAGFGVAGFASLTGMFDYLISQRVGRALSTSDALMIPGEQAVVFDGTQFTEWGLHLAPEIIDLVFGSGGDLTVGEIYTWVFVYEWKDAAGNVYQSAPSEPRQVPVNIYNQFTFTISNLRTTLKGGVSIVGYRTFSPTLTGTTAGVELRRVGSVTNSPTADSSTFDDTMSDQAVAVGQLLYTQPLNTNAPVALEFFPPPAFSKGVSFGDRQFVIGYDRAIWFSFQKTEGLGYAFNPFFRILLPTAANPVDIVPLDGRMAVFCDDGTQWSFPAAGLPNATLTQGAIPTPEQVPATAGATSSAVLTPLGALFGAITGPWLMDRGLQSKFIGAPVVDEVDATNQIVAINTDAYQRVYFAIGANGNLGTDSTVLVYDLISNCWYVWELPENVYATATWKGRFAFVDGAAVVHVMNTDESTDFTDDGDAILSIYEMAPVDFAGNVNGYESVWQVQYLGQYFGPHTMTIQIKYDISTSVSETFTQAVTTNPGVYRYEFMPTKIDCQAIALTFSDSFPGAPGNSFSLEAIGVLVGVESGLGRLPPTTRRIAP